MAKQGKKEKTTHVKTARTPRIANVHEGRSPGNIRQNDSSDPVVQFLNSRSPRHEIQGILFGALTLLLLVSLISQHIHYIHAVSGQTDIQNIAGVVGSVLADFVSIRRLSCLRLPFITLLLCIDKFSATYRIVNYGNMIALLLLMASLCALFGLVTMGMETQFSAWRFYRCHVGGVTD